MVSVSVSIVLFDNIAPGLYLDSCYRRHLMAAVMNEFMFIVLGLVIMLGNDDCSLYITVYIYIYIYITVWFVMYIVCSKQDYIRRLNRLNYLHIICQRQHCPT